MSSTSEVGHAKNVANLQKITQQVSTYSLYNPPIADITVPSLQVLYNDANAKLTEVGDKRNANKNAIVVRQTAFENLSSTCTSIINVLEIVGLPQGTLDQAKYFTKTIQGTSNKKTNPDSQQPSTDNPQPSTKNSTSRQSFTSKAENFGLLVQMLSTLPAYTPNEDNLKLQNLSTYHELLKASTLTVDQTESELNTKIIERDKILYAEETGVYAISLKIKKYVKSLYGATSPEFTTVSAIEFTNRK
ncbi:hypothetical protein NAL32_11935 [Chryseobacterium sp. Ch-15]|uniref:Uncharacterized protein n=1 Tax=Chryseobacterium muglaense TaxID=2893752 RepID=A0A9Q3UU71_9FLAO|nr:hypothetical protein [Chryseobacterium muglaense]MBD3905197.1 hypothetical protein [Chryseobacterium muglaense]MCC9034098.1 hypothetical protein [Chryseobacterium muglaense]MCM2555091.1 hypothetical protein [Chryseobacterium muglaense]